jgi:hypothetical protein
MVRADLELLEKELQGAKRRGTMLAVKRDCSYLAHI